MQAASLKNRVSLQATVNTVDSIGQPSTSWLTTIDTWASIKHQNGISAIKSGADTSVNRCSIRLRYRAGINAGMRVLHGAEIYDIQAVLPDENRVFVDLVAERINADV